MEKLQTERVVRDDFYFVAYFDKEGERYLFVEEHVDDELSRNGKVPTKNELELSASFIIDIKSKSVTKMALPTSKDS
jgi:hypothetical protein